MRIQNAIWFTELGGQCIGIVYGEDEITGERKAYIGTGYGEDEGLDVRIICANGAKFHQLAAEEIINYLQGTQDKDIEAAGDKAAKESEEFMSKCEDELNEISAKIKEVNKKYWIKPWRTYER